MLVDDLGRPLVGASVRVEVMAHAREVKYGAATGFPMSISQIRREVIDGSPVERLFITTTDPRGVFQFGTIPPDSGLRFSVTAADGRALRVEVPSGTRAIEQVLNRQGFITAQPGATARLVATPAARIAGRIVSRLPGVNVAGMRVWYQESQRDLDEPSPRNSAGDAVADDKGRFTFEDLDKGTVNVFVDDRRSDEPWTYRAAKDVALKSGQTADVAIELIRGVEVVGTVVTRGTKAPVKGAMMGVHGPYRPRSGAATRSSTTDAQGRFH